MGWIANLRTRREQRAQNRLIENTFAEAFERPNREQIREWDHESLHRALVSNELLPVERSMAEAELRRREAWAAPAGRSFIVSVIALAVSFAAVAISLSQLFARS